MKYFLMCVTLGLGLLAGGCDSDSNIDSSSTSTALIGATTTLDVPSSYATIQQAVQAAGNGDIIRVAAGEYAENIEVKNKSISLRGAGIAQTILRGSVEIENSSETSFEGFTVQGGGLHAVYSPVRISGNEIFASPGVGIRIEHCQNVVLSGLTLSGNRAGGIVFDDSSGVIGSSDIRNNFADGIVVNNSSPTILDNEITSNAGDGIAIRGFTAYAAPLLLENIVRENGSEGNYDVICFGSDSNPTGTGNAIERCLNCAECETFGTSVTYQQ